MKERIANYLILAVFIVAVNFAFATDQKITQLTAITAPDDADLFVVVDVSDTTMAATGTNKKMTWANLEANLDIADLDGYVAAEHIDWTVDQTPTYSIHAGNINNVIATRITSGTVVHERGGLEADVSGYSGLIAISGGATSEVDSKSELEAQIADVSDFCEADGDTYSGTHDFTGATLTATFTVIFTTEAITCASDVCTMATGKTSHYITTENNSAADVLAVGNGTTAGTMHRFALSVDGGDVVEVTPTTMTGGTKVTLDTAGDSVTLEWDGSAWFIAGGHGYAAS